MEEMIPNQNGRDSQIYKELFSWRRIYLVQSVFYPIPTTCIHRDYVYIVNVTG